MIEDLSLESSSRNCFAMALLHSDSGISRQTRGSSKMTVSLVILIVVLSTCLLLTGTAPAAEKKSDHCLECHPELRKPIKNVHRALALGCETCHMTVDAKEHPQEKGSIRLMQDMPGLCFSCHKKTPFQNKDIHSPVASGNCTGCHNPHGSELDMLLVSEPPELCYACHNREKFSKKYVHKIIMRRCSCHDQHASEYPHLLYASVSQVCTDCHRVRKSGNHVVSSLPRGKIHPVDGVPDPRNTKKLITCTTCHNPHSSEYQKLFPKPRICKMCHKYY